MWFYSFNDEWNNVANAIGPALSPTGAVKFQGPVFCCAKTWFPYIPTFIQKNQARLASIAVHFYPQISCPPFIPNLYTLVTDNIQPPSYVLDGLANATAAGLEFWLAETNKYSSHTPNSHTSHCII